MRKLTAQLQMTGLLQDIPSKIAVILPCSFPMLKRGNVGLKLVESLLILLWPGFLSSLVSQVCSTTFSNSIL